MTKKRGVNSTRDLCDGSECNANDAINIPLMTIVVTPGLEKKTKGGGEI